MSETVLVTGITGFVAERVALELLNAGYLVRGTVRSEQKANSVRQSLQAAGANVEALSFCVANLTTDEGWDEAMRGCDYVQHIASPFPIEQPRHKEALVPEAVGGTLRVLNAALEAGVERVVLTSSIAAMMYRPGRPPDVFYFSEQDWTDPEWSETHPYSVSKTRAELAAWEWADRHGMRDRLVVINPGVVLGPLLDTSGSTSTEIVKLMLTGKMSRTLPIANPVVDVRDVARLHVVVMTSDKAVGRRLIAAGDTLAFAEMAEILKTEYPALHNKLPKGDVHPLLCALMKKFVPMVRTIRAEVGIRSIARTEYVTELTGVSFRPSREALLATAESLLAHAGTS